MKNLTGKSLSTVAFTAIAFLFGACSQPANIAPSGSAATSAKAQVLPDLATASDVIADPSADTVASASDITDITTPDLSTDADATAGSSLQAQAGDRVPPVLTYSLGYTVSGYAVVYLEFSEKMDRDSVCKKAVKMVAVPNSGSASNVKGRCIWYDFGTSEGLYWVSNKTFSSGNVIKWKITRDAKDKAGNRLRAGKNGTFKI